MSTLLALTTREWKAFWYSPIAYVVGALFLVLQGWVFWLLVAVLNDPRVDPSFTMSQFFFGGTFFFWFSVLMMTPLLTMRAFSEEKRTGSIEFLLTAPVTDAQVVLSKFLCAWLSYIMLWMFTMVFELEEITSLLSLISFSRLWTMLMRFFSTLESDLSTVRNSGPILDCPELSQS